MRAAILVLLLTASPAHANFHSYFQWSQLPQSQKNGYVAGVLDFFFTFDAGNEQLRIHYEACIFNNKLTDGQLADGIAAFAAANPSKQTSPMPAIIFEYLGQLCGTLPEN